ncbi:MAG TPA: hypothetical protein VGJ94_13010 [Syntrophorhabdaceae bacterium]|jgi:hypothetical protein
MAARRRERSVFSFLFFAVIITVFTSVFSQGYLFAWTCQGTDAQCALFEEAVIDTRDNFNAGRLWNRLTPIVSDNGNLIWKDGVVGSKLLVAAYKYGTPENPPFNTCQPGVPFPKDCPVSGSPWVTIVPELFDFFKTTPFSTLRIEQLLGLPPNYGNNYIVEYWANPSDLFRPAPDPQITYQEGSITFPWESSHFLSLNTSNDYKVWDDYCVSSSDPACTCAAGSQYMDYKCWFQNRREWVYAYSLSSAPYPWTGLGYTYDWGNRQTPVGLSEFVLNKAPVYSPFTVTIQSVSLASAYFSRSSRYRMTVEKSGFGKGTVSGRPGGTICGPNCSTGSKNLVRYSSVTLTARPARGSSFVGWGGACSGMAATCTLTMAGDTTVTAGFALSQ